MEIGKTLYVATRKAWRSWLVKNHDKEKEIWLIYFKKKSGKPRISYNAAVEEALCYGWIDSTVKSLDKACFAQRFSVRRKTSRLSQMNKERIYRLLAHKKMTHAGFAAIAHVFNSEKDKAEHFTISSDILKSLKKNEQAWKNFQKFSDSYKRIRIAYIESRRSKSPDIFQKSLEYFIKKTAQNKRFGFAREIL